MSFPFFNCEDTNERLSEYLDGTLPWWSRLLVRIHLLFCPGCRAILATLAALPILVRDLEEEAPPEAEAALAGALARIKGPGAPRPWPAKPVPMEVAPLLDTLPDLPLSILAATHSTLAGTRSPAAGPYHLPEAILTRLPPEDQWRWEAGPGGRRRAELLQDPERGQRLVLAYSPTGARSRAHRHLGSESILVLAGTLKDQGQALAAGDWVHHGLGSLHAPEIPEEDCWCLIREEGGTVAAGPLDRLRLFRGVE
jgi:anti-sigma factor ChrR (cupin superfamily)